LLICSLIPPFYQTCSAGHSYPGAELRGILSIKTVIGIHRLD